MVNGVKLNNIKTVDYLGKSTQIKGFKSRFWGGQLENLRTFKVNYGAYAEIEKVGSKLKFPEIPIKNPIF